MKLHRNGLSAKLCHLYLWKPRKNHHPLPQNRLLLFCRRRVNLKEMIAELEMDLIRQALEMQDGLVPVRQNYWVCVVRTWSKKMKNME